MEDNEQGFSALSSLIRLISLVDIKLRGDDLCREMLSDMSSKFGINRVACFRLQKDTGSLMLAGTSDHAAENRNPIELDAASSDWLLQLQEDNIKVIESTDGIPSTLTGILGLEKDRCVTFFLSREVGASRHLLILSAGKERASDLRNCSTELTDFLRGVAIIFEALGRMGESILLRFDVQSFFELAPIGIIVCSEDGAVISANEQALLILGCGLASDTLVGENLLSGEPFKESGIEQVIMRALAGEQVDIENLRFKCPSGKNVYLDIRFRATKSHDGKARIIGILADVTQRIRLQQQLERSYRSLTEAYQELQRIDKMKTRFIDTVSHELRTPLTVMRGYLEMLQSEYSDKLDQKVMAKIKSIRANTERLYDLVEAMLDVARIEQGAMEIVKQEASIKNLIEDVLSSQQALAHDKHQEITLVLQGELGSAMIDYRKIRDALKNILNNAVRYTPEGGKIQVGAADEGKMIHIWVKDNGIGIPTSDLEKIFDRFHIVVAKELSHQVDRMGLGLPLAKGIVDAHGGKIWVESEVGKGSVFHINLPKK
ncbi:MAG: PAS domain-containing sensor histidine kinase [Thermoplasmata archaeon]